METKENKMAACLGMWKLCGRSTDLKIYLINMIKNTKQYNTKMSPCAHKIAHLLIERKYQVSMIIFENILC